MLKGKFKILGSEKRDHEGKTYMNALVRASDGSVHKVQSEKDLSSFLDKDVNLVLNFTWGKYNAGVSIVDVLA